jgi:uncharacterized protein YndB with AHSA1/START domain
MMPPPLRLVRVLDASPEDIFDAWIDSESLAIWMCPGSVQRSVAEVDARVGGRFRIVMKGPDCDHEHEGEYLVLDRPSRLVFTWVSEATRRRPSTVSVDLKRIGPGRTELTLTHEGLPDELAVVKHGSGWGSILEKLGAALARGKEGG